MRSVDVAVVGGGPAGLAAAAAAAEAGAETLLIDEYSRLGGQYLRPKGPAAPPARAIDRLHKAGAQTLLGEPVWHISTDDRLLETLAGPLRYRALVLATGAYDRPLAVPGSLLPGVATAGAVQALAKDGVPLGKHILVAGCGPFALAVATAVHACGGAVTEIAFTHWPMVGRAAAFEPRIILEGLRYTAGLLRHRVPLRAGWVVAAVHGDERVSGATLVRLDRDRRPTSERRHVSCDAVALGYGFLPQLALADIAGCALRYDAKQRTWFLAVDAQLATTVPTVYAAGELVGIGGHRCAAAEGERAGRAAAAAVGRCAPPVGITVARHRRQRAFARAVTPALTAPSLVGVVLDEAVICRCEMVTAFQIRSAVRDGAETLNGVRMRTRCGMGICQGRTCGQLAAEVIADEAGWNLKHVGRFTARSPAKPVTVEALA